MSYINFALERLQKITFQLWQIVLVLENQFLIKETTLFYMSDVIMLLYISSPGWPNINALCIRVDGGKFSVFRVGHLCKSLATYGLVSRNNNSLFSE